MKRPMKFVILLVLFLLSIPTLGMAQCGCGDGDCSSSCMCGCQDPEKSQPPFGGGYAGKSGNVAFLSHVPLGKMMGEAADVRGNDCWGWTDKKTGREFAIMGMTHGTSFVEITTPTKPRFLGFLPGAGTNSTWRDIKVYNERAYIVGDGSGNNSHGVQVFELRRLLKAPLGPATFTADARYTGLGRAHNIAINESTGFAYVVGSPSQSSSGGLIVLDLKNGVMPTLHSVFSADGYTHDTQVVNYNGPDTDHFGKEIAFCSNEDTLTIVNVTKNGNPPAQISRTGYAQSRYSHQGWLSDDHKFFYMNDELDELQLGPFQTRTHVWNVQDLDSPIYVGKYDGTESTIDHNLYVKGDYIFQAHYTSGLRILKRNPVSGMPIFEAGYYDTYGPDNGLQFNGAWSCYPYFPSGNMIVSDIQGGLFVVRFQPPTGQMKGVMSEVVKVVDAIDVFNFFIFAL